MLTFGSLFAGIGGFDLGFERAGMKCVWQVEIDEYCRRVLAKHWPDVPRYDDVRTFPPRSCEWRYEPRRFLPRGPFRPNHRTDTTRAKWYADVICGGFPCQDISWGNPSGPYRERLRKIREITSILKIANPALNVTREILDLTDLDKPLEINQ
jgi:site-specific DNA-cytosine methylase